MPDEREPNVFSREFLALIYRHEPVPLASYEAAWAGPWRVEPHGREFAVIREPGGEPEAVTQFRETALLLAALLPATAREPLYRLEPEEHDGYLAALETVLGQRGRTTVGRLRSLHEGLLEPLNAAEFLLRSPPSLAYLLEAASYEALVQAGALLARKIAETGDRGEES